MEHQARVILWAIPRTLSTAFLKCMSGIPNSMMFYEPYTSAHLFGPDQPYGDAPGPADDVTSPANDSKQVYPEIAIGEAVSGYDDSICTYKWVKEQLEAPHQGKQVIFIKDVAYSLNKKYEFLPTGYKYIFLIRNPLKVMPSWKKLISDFTAKRVEDFVLDELTPPVMPTGLGYGELLELYEYVQQRGIDQEPIIIDADDLVADPDAVLSSCCKKIGVPYTRDLLTWAQGGGVVETWAVSKKLKIAIRDLSSYDNVKQSSCFIKPEARKESHDNSSLSV